MGPLGEWPVTAPQKTLPGLRLPARRQAKNTQSRLLPVTSHDQGQLSKI